jgi:hypothetical protein
VALAIGSVPGKSSIDAAGFKKQILKTGRVKMKKVWGGNGISSYFSFKKWYKPAITGFL